MADTIYQRWAAKELEGVRVHTELTLPPDHEPQLTAMWNAGGDLPPGHPDLLTAEQLSEEERRASVYKEAKRSASPGQEGPPKRPKQG